VTNIYQSFTYKMAAKSTGICMKQSYATVTLCNSAPALREAQVSRTYVLLLFLWTLSFLVISIRPIISTYVVYPNIFTKFAVLAEHWS